MTACKANQERAVFKSVACPEALRGVVRCLLETGHGRTAQEVHRDICRQRENCTTWTMENAYREPLSRRQPGDCRPSDTVSFRMTKACQKNRKLQCTRLPSLRMRRHQELSHAEPSATAAGSYHRNVASCFSHACRPIFFWLRRCLPQACSKL